MNKTWKLLFEMIRYSLAGGESPDIAENVDWESLYKICEFHKIGSGVAHAIDKMPRKERIPEEIRKKFQQSWQLEAARDVAQQFALEEILQGFEEAGVYCLPLKGVLLKQCYPRTDLRMMSDLDILFQPEQEKKVDEVLEKLGYHCDQRGWGCHVYFRKPFMNIEMHYALFLEGHRFAPYYEKPWEKAVSVEGKKYVHQYSWEDFYIYVIVHFAKHFQNGGSGIRSILDIWQFEKKMKEKMDWTYVESELEKLGLKEFLHRMEKLVAVWFEGEAGTPFYDRLTEMIVGSGIYGTVQNYWVNNVASSGKRAWTGQLKVWLSTVFLPYNIIKLKPEYTYLQKYPILLPAAWVQRIIIECFRREKKIGEVLAGKKVDLSKARGTQEIFEELGL